MKNNKRVLLMTAIVILILSFPVFADGDELAVTDTANDTEMVSDNTDEYTELTQTEAAELSEDASEIQDTVLIPEEEPSEKIDNEDPETFTDDYTGTVSDTDMYAEDEEEEDFIDYGDADLVPSYRAVFEGVWDEDSESTTWEERT